MKKALLSFFIILPIQADEIVQFVPIKTTEGCTAYLAKQFVERPEFLGFSWNGRCVNGKIHGVGRSYVKTTTDSEKDPDWSEYDKGRPKSPYWVIKPMGQISTEEKGLQTYSQSECVKIPACKSILKKAMEYGEAQDTVNLLGKNKPSQPSQKTSQLSIMTLCFRGAACGLHFVHYENGQDPTTLTPQYFARTNGSSVTANYKVKDCPIGWTANVGGAIQSTERNAHAMICGASTREGALKSGFEECKKEGGFDCKTAEIIDVQWAYWDGSYYSDPNPEYEAKLKGSPNSIGGTGGGACRLYDQNLISCDKYRDILKSIGVGH